MKAHRPPPKTLTPQAGSGDYIEERRTLLPDWDAETLIQKAKELQKARETAPNPPGE